MTDTEPTTLPAAFAAEGAAHREWVADPTPGNWAAYVAARAVTNSLRED